MTPRASALLAGLLALGLVTAASIAIARTRARAGASRGAFVVRPFVAEAAGRWIGDAVAYGPHRDGQNPRGASPTVEQVSEDLRLMAKDWGLLRIYGAVGTSDTVLEAIRRTKIPMKVVLGLWLDAEDRRDSTGRVLERFPAAVASNEREVEAAIRQANRHPREVIAITVGNETQVFWSGNRLPADRLVHYLRRVREGTKVPVSTADDYNFWNKPESRAVAQECDFVFTHLHPLWNSQQLDEALPWIERNLEAIRALHPERPVVIGETGWATQRNDQGDQGRLMKGELGEEAQARFYAALRPWIARHRVTTFVFEAFDENWKGSPDPAEVEKHWGLYHTDRTPKLAMKGERR